VGLDVVTDLICFSLPELRCARYMGSRVSVALVVLFSDTLEAVWPIFTSDQWKVVGLAM
jgi:hypothetical protein